MRPELRRSLALAAVLAVVLAVGALWLATQGGPEAPATPPAPSASPTTLPATVAPSPATPTASSVEAHAIEATPEPTNEPATATGEPATATPPAATATPTPLGVAVGIELANITGTPAYFPVVVIPPPTATPGPVNPPSGGDWRAFLAYYRALAHLPSLVENAGWSAGAFNHARYLVENDVNTSGEDPALSFYTAEGAAAGPNSLWQVRGEANWNDVQSMDNWMRWPFHALAIIDPALHSFGYGRYSEPGGDPGPFHTGAVLDVRRGLGLPNAAYPVKWPEHNAAVYLTSYDGGEQPDPLTSCSGISLNGPAGLPILLQIGTGSVIGPNTPRPVVTASSFKENGVERAHCVFDETNYQNSIDSLRDQGRALLATRDAIVLIPNAPLSVGQNYTVSLTAYGQTHTWTFRVVNKP